MSGVVLRFTDPGDLAAAMALGTEELRAAFAAGLLAMRRAFSARWQ